MTNLVKTLAEQVPGLTYTDARESIGLYAERNDRAHGHFDQLAEKGSWRELARKMADDYINTMIECPVGDEVKRATQRCIKACIGQYFRVFKMEDGVLTSWTEWGLNELGKVRQPDAQPEVDFGESDEELEEDSDEEDDDDWEDVDSEDDFGAYGDESSDGGEVEADEDEPEGQEDNSGEAEESD